MSAELRAVRAQVLELSTGFVDPDDALRHLDLDEYELGQDGKLLESDRASIVEDLAEVLRRRPNLAKPAEREANRTRRRRPGGRGVAAGAALFEARRPTAHAAGKTKGGSTGMAAGAAMSRARGQSA